MHDDPEKFDAKRKLFDFFISCHSLKSIDDCHLETFVYFKPLFGYIITKNYFNASANEHRNVLNILEGFLKKAENNVVFRNNHIRLKLVTLKERFHTPQYDFQTGHLNQEYADLRIYPESYRHNIRNLELYRKRNSTYEMGVQRTMLDWSLYVFQSRHKPISYYFPTLSVHLWMTLFNNTERELRRDHKTLGQLAECLKLPEYVRVIDEAVILAVVYWKSFENAYQDLNQWTLFSDSNKEKFDHQNHILNTYHLDNKRLFFTLYAQNFCDFGKELAENVFYMGLRNNHDFFTIYACGEQKDRIENCF